MTTEELNELEKAMKKAKFQASQKAGELHDLVEDRLPADFEDIPAYAEATYAACKKWYDLNQEFLAAKK